MYNLMGINSAGIPEIQTAIKNYRQAIDNDLAQLTSEVDYSVAFKGNTLADNMETYLGNVIAEIQKMTRFINDFSAALAQVGSNYEAEATSLGSTIGTDASNVEGVQVTTTTGVNGYTTTGQSNG